MQRLVGTRRTPSGKFEARVSMEGSVIHLGTFDTEQEAHERFITERAKRQSSKRSRLPEKANEKTKGNP